MTHPTPTRRVAALITFDTTMTDEQIAYVLGNAEVQIEEPVVGYDEHGNEQVPADWAPTRNIEARVSVDGLALQDATTRDESSSASRQHYIETADFLLVSNPLVRALGNDDDAWIEDPTDLFDLLVGESKKEA